MEKATISQLKNHLSRYLRKVRAGASILVLDRDEPVARLEAVSAGTVAPGRLERLERAGLVRRPARPPRAPHALPGPVRARESVLAALLDERREGR